MDVAYDHIQEEALSPEEVANKAAASSQAQSNLNTEFQEAFKAVSSSPWGAALGGWLSQAKKQGENLYSDLQKEATEASTHATKGFSSLREQVADRTRGLSLKGGQGPLSTIPGEEGLPIVPTIVKSEDGATVTGADAENSETPGVEKKAERISVDIVKEAGSLVASFRQTAAARLRDLQRAEDAADEALLKFGSNVRNFLRDAVTISAPDDGESRSELLFETQEPGTGKKVFHSTRLDAQLHAIHTNAGSFTDDPQGEQWRLWSEDFDVEKQTIEIAGDLERYEELRRAMEKLVPEKIEYKAFWTRYYFLRKAIEEDEKKRKEVLKGAAADSAEEVNWDDDEDEPSSTPQPQPHEQASVSTTTLNASSVSNDLLRPEGRRSEDENKSVAGSEASYDMVSGATSRTLGSPKERKQDDNDSDDDWE